MKSFPILLLALCEPVKALSLSGLVRRLKDEVPHARITLVTTEASGELYRDDGLIDELLALEGAIFNLKALKALSGLSRQGWGLCVDIGPSLVSRMIRARTRFTLDAGDRAGPLTQICRALRLDEAEVMPELRVSERHEARARGLLTGGRGDGPWLIMAPGAGWIGRRWPTERFAVLATRLMRDDGPFPGSRLLVVGDEADRDTAIALAMATPRAHVLELTGKLDPMTAFAAMRQGTAFVGNDEIWLHLAAAAGIPAFGLLGPSDDAQAPPGDQVHIIRGPRRFADIEAVDPKLKHQVCHMLDLSIDKVYDSIAAVTPKPGGTAAHIRELGHV